MRLMTLNIRFGAGTERLDQPGYDAPSTEKTRLRIRDAILALAPDVAALQEVRSRRQAERLAADTRMGLVYTAHPASYAFDFFEWGLALLFKGRCIEAAGRSIHFDRDLGTGRQGLVATLVVGGSTIVLCNLHLDPRDVGGQLDAALGWLPVSGPPTILLGDFNCLPDAEALEPIRGRWVDTCRAIASPSAREADRRGTLLRPGSRVDQIWAPRRGCRITEAGLLPSTHRDVSDHLGYFADLHLGPRSRSRLPR